MDSSTTSILTGSLILFGGWLVCLIADKYYKFKGNSYYWFVGMVTGIIGGLMLCGGM